MSIIGSFSCYYGRNITNFLTNCNLTASPQTQCSLLLCVHKLWWRKHKLSIINKIESERTRKISALPKDMRLYGRDCLTDLYETLFPKLELINTRSYWFLFLWNCNNNNKSSYSWELMNECLSNSVKQHDKIRTKVWPIG